MKNIKRHLTRFLQLLLLILLLQTSVRAQFIDFENLAAPPKGTGGLVVANQFPDLTFNFQAALDYSSIPGFAHSGKNAIEICLGKEFCSGQLEITFNELQQNIKLWVGYDNSLTFPEPVIMKGFDQFGTQVTSNTIILRPASVSSGRIPIQFRLELNTPASQIKKVTVGFVNADGINLFNNGLVFDDLEYDKTGAAPSCPATSAPILNLTSPADGSAFVQNVFNLNADIIATYNFTQFPFSTMTVTTTDTKGVIKTFGPVFLTSFNWVINGLTGFLLPGENKLIVKFTDCAGSAEVSRTVFFGSDIKSTGIHVIDKDGNDVPGAQVYSDKFLGVTNSKGRLVVTPVLPDGTSLVARKQVDIDGTSFVWTRKVYQTSMAIQNTGAVTRITTPAHPNPAADIELKVLPENALIAFSLKASIEWDASDAEMEDIRLHFDSASRYLYNATDGQFIIEKVDLQDDEHNWSDAEYRIYGNQNLRSNAREKIKMARPALVGLDDRDGYSKYVTYVHEYGHYAFGLQDEYDLSTPRITWCAPALFAPPTLPPNIPGPFEQFQEKAACLMSFQYRSFKFCSNRIENPHIMGTLQGTNSCWTDISNNFKDNNTPSRWIIQTPDTRAAIPGRINNGFLPVTAWQTQIDMVNHNRGALCSPIFLTVADRNGKRLPGEEIWLHTTYGQDVLQGNTDTAVAKSGEGIWCTGFHIGDSFGNLLMTASECALLQTPFAMHVGGAADEMDTIPPSRIRTIVMSPAALGIKMSVSPVSTNKFDIRVRMDSTSNATKKVKAPKLTISIGDSLRQVNIPMTYNSLTGEYRVISMGFPFFADGKLRLIFDDNGKPNSSMAAFTIGYIKDKGSLLLSSANGKTSIKLAAASLPDKSRIVMGPSVIPGPPLTKGNSLVIKPVNIDAGSINKLSKEGTLNFYVNGTVQYNLALIQVLHFNTKTKNWERIKHSFVDYPLGIVTANTNELGVFAVIAVAAK